VPSFVENMGIDHGCADVLVAKQLLDGPNIVTAFEQNPERKRFLGVHPISQNQNILLH